MRNAFILAVGILFAFFSSGCQKEDATDATKAAYIAFVTDSGFVYRDDTLPLADTLHVGIIATEGSDALRTLYVELTYDNEQPVRQDSVHVTGNPFSYQRTIHTRAQAGKEKWSFTVQESDGDRTKRSLTLTVQ